MPARLVILALLFALWVLPGCGGIRVKGPFANDPLTGGMDTTSSQLLDIRLPAGMQRYSSHGFTLPDSVNPAGLEVLRGQVDTNQAVQSLASGLQAAGWQLRLNISKGKRITQVYDNAQDVVVLHFRPQAAFTILEIWRGARLADGAGADMFAAGPFSGLSDKDSSDSITELPGETFPPLPDEVLEENPPKPGHVEEWGSAPLQEREL